MIDLETVYSAPLGYYCAFVADASDAPNILNVFHSFYLQTFSESTPSTAQLFYVQWNTYKMKVRYMAGGVTKYDVMFTANDQTLLNQIKTALGI